MRVLIGVLAFAFMGAVQAQNLPGNIYVTAGVGAARIDNGEKDNLDRALYHAGVGLNLGKNFAVEGLYHQMQDISYDNCSTSMVPVDSHESRRWRPVFRSVTTCDSETFTPKAYSVSGIAKMDVKGASPFLRAGYLINDHGGDGWLAGAGVDWKFLRVEYQHFEDFNVGYDAKVDSVNLSVKF